MRVPMNPDHDVPRFVDRDMFLRFLGGGVGHKATPTEDSLGVAQAGTTADEEPPGQDESCAPLEADPEGTASDEEDSASESELGDDEAEEEEFCDPEDGEGDGEDLTALEGYGAL
jgi:hypothetical protein